MKQHHLQIPFCISLGLVLFLQMPAVFACSFASQSYFTYSTHPDLPATAYAEGKLGIIESTYARSYLFVAYRYLSNKPLSAHEKQTVISLWNTRLTASDSNCATVTDDWLKVRNAVSGIKKVDSIYTERPVSKDEPWQTYCNCQTSAFETAGKTLKSLLDKYGPTAEAVKEWIKAQDEVFSNCGENSYSDAPKQASIPAPLPATAEAVLRNDRAYQIAAADFYAQNFAKARTEFEAIAADTSSSWHKIASYLAVRSMLRQASLAKPMDKALLLEAGKRLKTMLAEPEFADMRADLLPLESFVAAKSRPAEHLQELVAHSDSLDDINEITSMIDVLLPGESDGSSGVTTAYKSLPAYLKAPDILDWVITFQSTDESAKHHALDKWKQTHSVPWLVAAIESIDANDPNAKAIVKEAEEKSASGSARWTLFFHVNRIKIANNKDDEVRAALDKVLDSPPADLPAGAANQLRTQRLGLARNLDEFIRFGIQRPLSVCSNGGTTEVPDDMDQLAKGELGKQEKVQVTPEAGEFIDNQASLGILKQLAMNPRLVPDIKNNIAWTSWVRAVLINDVAAARELAVITKPLNKAKQKYFDDYLAASNPESRQFAAANLMLHFSSANPNPSWDGVSEDGYGDASGWWWSAKPIAGEISLGWGNSDDDKVTPLDLEFITAAQKAQAKAQLAKLETVETAPNYFAKIVIPFAKAHPQDPRVPEALHFLVKATRYGMTDDKTKVYSKEAFNLLHKNYKGSTWAKQTPYYY